MIPADLGGYRVEPVDIAGPLSEAKGKAYVDDVRFVSLRAGDRLAATFEVARFAPDAPVEDPDFRLKVSAQVGESAPRLRRIGEEFVYVAAGNKQTYFMWFKGIYFMLLGVPSENATGRTLVREVFAKVNP